MTLPLTPVITEDDFNNRQEGVTGRFLPEVPFGDGTHRTTNSIKNHGRNEKYLEEK